MKAPLILALVVSVAFFSVLLRRWRPEQALALSLAAGVCIVALTATWLAPVFDKIQRWASISGVDSTYADILFKGIGVALLTQLCADTCRDAGEGALAAKAELAGKLCLLLLALPLLQQVADTAFSLLQGGSV